MASSDADAAGASDAAASAGARLHRLMPWLIGALIVLVDQVSKQLVLASIEPREYVSIVQPYVQLVNVRNPGIAFGLHLGALSRPFFILASMAVLAAMISLYRGTERSDRLRRLGIVVLCAGAVGNLIDRIRWAEGVVDFIRVVLWAREWPIFNFADVAVTAGAVMLGASLLRETQPRRDF